MKISFKARQVPFSMASEICAHGEFEDGVSVSEMASSLCGGNEFDRFALDGKEVDGDFVPEGECHSLLAWCVPRDPATLVAVGTFLLKTLIVVAISAVVNIGIGMLMKKKKPKYKKQLDEVSDSQYGWDYNAQNAVEEGSPIPVLYGRRMVLPPTVMSRITTDNEANDSYMTNIYAVCEGGSGFNDVITYPKDPDNGLIVADLDHARWWSHLRSVESQSGETNLIRGRSVLTSAMVDKIPVSGNEHSEMTDGTTAFYGFKNKYAAGKIFFTTEALAAVSSLVIYMRRLGQSWMSYFEAYGRKGNDSPWEYLGDTSGPSESFFLGEKAWRYVIVPRTGTTYKQFYLAPKGLLGEGRYVSYFEIELYGKLGDGDLSDRIGMFTTAGELEGEEIKYAAGTWASLPVNKVLDTVGFVFMTTGKTSPDSLAVHIEFPYGLYELNASTGKYESKEVKLEIRARPIMTDGSRGDWFGFFPSGEVISVKDSVQGKKSLCYEKSVTQYGGESYEVSARFFENPNPGDSSEIVCEANWTGVDEGWNFSCLYPRTSVASMKALATKTLSNGTPQLRILAERKTVYAKNPITGAWEAKDASNPAWAAYDMLVHPIFDDTQENQDRIYNETADPEDQLQPGDHAILTPDLYDYALIGYAHPDRSISYADFSRWADFCDREGITCSMYYDGSSNLAECLRMLLEIGRANLINRGNEYGVWIDKEADITDTDGNPVGAYVFDDSNIVKDSWTVSYSDQAEMPTQINVTFYDRDREWNRFTVSRRNNRNDVDRVPNTMDVQLYPCDDRGVAERHAEYLIRQCLTTKTYSWTGTEESIPLEIGDIVQVRGDFCVITSVTLDDRMRRQFTAVEYAKERFQK